MSETEKALREMKARLAGLAKQTPSERFQHLVKQGVIDSTGQPTGLSMQSLEKPPTNRR